MAWRRRTSEEIVAFKKRLKLNERRSSLKLALIMPFLMLFALWIFAYCDGQKLPIYYWIYMYLVVTGMGLLLQPVLNSRLFSKLSKFCVNLFMFNIRAERAAYTTVTQSPDLDMLQFSGQTNMICTNCHVIQSTRKDVTCKECGSTCENPEHWIWIEEEI